MSSSNGKGDKLRKGANLLYYRNNYDSINWSKKEGCQLSTDPYLEQSVCKPPHMPQVDPLPIETLSETSYPTS